MKRQVVLFIAMSIDGFIAKDEDNIEFLSIVDRPGEDYGYADFTNTVDTVIWGRKTYDKVKTLNPAYLHQDKKVYVITRSRSGQEGHVEYYNGPVSELIASLQSSDGKHIYCDGGAEVIHALLEAKLIDRMIISIIPHMVGNGVRLFKGDSPEQALRLTRSTQFPSGLVQLWYEKA